jgi:large subunit ribosomal protein L22
MITVRLKNYRQSPRKVRLVADMVRGKKADAAMISLSFVPHKASDSIQKLLKSAIANADNNHGIKSDELFIKEIRIDQGVTAYRFRPRARGRAFPIRKRSSHIILSLDSKEGVDLSKKVEDKKEAVKTPEKKEEVKKTSDKKTTTKKTAVRKTAAKKVTKKVNKETK